MTAPRICPICGTAVPPNAKACPECGSDEQTGWSEAAYAPQPELPDDEFDYDQFVQREFGAGKQEFSAGKKFWLLVAIVALVLILLMSL